MAKILLIVVVFAAVYFIVRAYARGVAKRQSESARANRVEDMVRCSHCGLHLPRSDSTRLGERYFCSKEHQRLHES